MTKKTAKTKPKNRQDALWIDAKRKCRLNNEDIRMAKEMGLNPRSLIKNIPSKSEAWKLPVKDWIREMYEKRQDKAAKKKSRKEQALVTNDVANPAPFAEDSKLIVKVPLSEVFSNGEEVISDNNEKMVYDPFNELASEDEEHCENEDEFFFDDFDGPPESHKIDRENQSMRRRQAEFRMAAEYVADAFSQIAAVQKIVLFGSVARALKKEVPRFRRFRRAGIAIAHECQDVDLAVWLAGLDCLRILQKTRSQALNQLLAERDLGVAHHQVDIFIMEPGTDRYLGRLCSFATCPKGKEKCLVSECGKPRFLQQHEDFNFDAKDLHDRSAVVLFDRHKEADEQITPDLPF